MAIERLLRMDPVRQSSLGIRFTPAEIAQQPRVWPAAAAAVSAVAGELRSLLEGSEEVVLTGAGSSYFVGRSAEAALAPRLAGRRVRAVPSTEIVMDPLGTLPARPFTLVSIARSGNSPEGNAAFRLAEELRGDAVRHIVLTCSGDGELARLGRSTSHPSAVVLMPAAANDQGLAMTSSFTSLLVAALGLGFLDRPGEYVEVVERLAQAFPVLCRAADDLMASLAERKVERAFFIGSGSFFGAALESHLKVQELTAGEVVGKAEETLGLRHGPLAGINPATLVVLFGSSSPYRRRYEADLARELAAKELGLARIVVCGRADPAWHESAHHVLEFDPEGRLNLDDDLVAPLLVLPAQLYGLYRSLALGLEPDTPSRAKVITRVVQGVTIYPFIPGDRRN